VTQHPFLAAVEALQTAAALLTETVRLAETDDPLWGFQEVGEQVKDLIAALDQVAKVRGWLPYSEWLRETLEAEKCADAGEPENPPAGSLDSHGEHRKVEKNGQCPPRTGSRNGLAARHREALDESRVLHSEAVAAPGGIDFGRFKKLKEPLVVERIVEVVAHLRGEEGPVVLRLEALRSPDQTGCQPRYEVAVYRRTTVSVRSRPTSGKAPKEDVRVWSACDLISSDRPTAEWALEQVLGFLEGRCR